MPSAVYGVLIKNHVVQRILQRSTVDMPHSTVVNVPSDDVVLGSAFGSGQRWNEIPAQ